MNKKLIIKIEKKIGRQILNRGDCQYLSDRIFEEIIIILLAIIQ